MRVSCRANESGWQWSAAMSIMLSALSLLTVLSIGCGGSAASDAVSCDYRGSSSAEKVCEEWANVPATEHDSLAATCRSPQVWAESGCPRSGALGGCAQSANGITTTIWFYADPTNGIGSAADVSARCKQNSQMFISP
jgi:hypothetical protein